MCAGGAATAALAGVLLALLLALVTASASAAPGDLAADRAKARELAAEVQALDARIDSAVERFARATRALEAVRAEIRDNRRQQRVARYELEVARATLAERAVALYKQDDVTALDAMLTADDFGELVGQLTMVRSIARSDRDVLRTITHTRRELADVGVSLTADERTIEKLVDERAAELRGIRDHLSERRALLSGVRGEIRRLAAQQAAERARPAPLATPSVSTEAAEGGWWSLIKKAAAANGVSARGLYRLMMIESGGSATAVGPGGYYGLYQYAPSTWKASWNPWRASKITDGPAQIRATALAIRLGYGASWWAGSYAWAFGGE